MKDVLNLLDPYCICVLVASFIPFLGSLAYKAYQALLARTERDLEQLQAVLYQMDGEEETNEPQSEGSEPDPMSEPGKVKCEYCDSYVDAGTNCPNCGAVLPRAPEGSVLDGVVYFGQAAYGFGSVIELEKFKQYQNGIITANKLRKKQSEEGIR